MPFQFPFQFSFQSIAIVCSLLHSLTTMTLWNDEKFLNENDHRFSSNEWRWLSNDWKVTETTLTLCDKLQLDMQMNDDWIDTNVRMYDTWTQLQSIPDGESSGQFGLTSSSLLLHITRNTTKAPKTIIENEKKKQTRKILNFNLIIK